MTGKPNPAIFRSYDVRGSEADLDDPLVRALGGAIAAAIPGGPIAVGRDCRLSSPRIRDALVDGITAAGADVIDVGVVPSPVLYFACHRLEVAGGVEITGSHNPPGDNGFKILAGTRNIHGAEIADLRDRIEAGIDRADARGEVSHRDLTGAYVEFAASTLELGDRRPAVVVDGGNGAGGPTAVALYRAIGCPVSELHCEMDGRFPNHHPDPTIPENLAELAERVVAEGAELGVGLDGDGDRIGAVDGRGRVLAGDQLMLLLGRALLAEVPGATLIGEVKCSQTMFDGLVAAGGQPLMWKVGHSLIKAKMIETGALLAGEMSGHLFFAHRYLGFDDGAYAGARLIELLSRTQRSLAELRDELPPAVNTPEIRVPCADDRKFAVVERAAALLGARDDVLEVIDIDGARARFDGGWGLIRASNTQAALVLRCEATDDARLAEIRGIIEGVIDRAAAA